MRPQRRDADLRRIGGDAWRGFCYGPRNTAIQPREAGLGFGELDSGHDRNGDHRVSEILTAYRDVFRDTHRCTLLCRHAPLICQDVSLTVSAYRTGADMPLWR